MLKFVTYALSPRFRPDICMCNICCLEKAQSYFHQECTQGLITGWGIVGLSLTGSWDCLYTSLGGDLQVSDLVALGRLSMEALMWLVGTMSL